MRGTRSLVLLAGLALASPARAGGVPNHPWWDVFCPPRLRLSLCCPDDYCSKPPPALPPPYCPCGSDEYCPKPVPCLLPEYWPCGCDDYCPKPPPGVPCCDLPGAKCSPTDGCCPRPWCWWLCWPWWGKGLCKQ